MTNCISCISFYTCSYYYFYHFIIIIIIIIIIQLQNIYNGIEECCVNIGKTNTKTKIIMNIMNIMSPMFKPSETVNIRYNRIFFYLLC
jgi:hypothetical protein